MLRENNLDLNELEFHHIGLLVESIENSIPHYSMLFGKENISDIIMVSSQKVKVCFVKNAKNSFIELVEPLGEGSKVYKLLKKGISYYHIAYKVVNIASYVTKLEGLNYKALEYFYSEAFNNKKCIFLFSPDGHLIELIEK
jgi:hypothetical protein